MNFDKLRKRGFRARFVCALESLNPRFDDGEFRSQHFQRAFQYLKLWETAKQDLDHFCFVPNNTMGDYADCLEILMR